MSPAIKNYRKYLVDELHHARIIEDEEALAMLYAEYDILAPYIQLFKNFPKFLKWNIKICSISNFFYNSSLSIR